MSPAQGGGALPEVDEFLKQLDSRWSFDACSSLSRTVETRDEAFAAFDAQMALLRSISQLVNDKVAILIPRVAAQRNRFCKINNLPTELLETILLLACENGFCWWALWDIMNTCKSWHSIVSAQPRAYSTINLSSMNHELQLAELFALRSKPLPLDVRSVTGFTHGPPATMKQWKSLFCFDHISRIRSLEVVLPCARIDRWLIETPAPCLERFTILSDEETSEPATFINETAMAEDVFPQLFGGQAPNLRTLSLKSGRLAWSPGNYKNLTNLTIELNGSTIGQTTLDTHDFTVIFENSPHLVNLRLDRAAGDWMWSRSRDAPATPPGSNDTRHIMRSLRSLNLYLPLSYILRILRAIELTETIESLDVECFGESVVSHDSPETEIAFPDHTIIPDFLFAALDHLFIGSHIFYPEIIGRGQIHNHPYTFKLQFPLEQLSSVAETIFTTRLMPLLSRLSLPYDIFQVLPRLLACSRTITKVDILESHVAAEKIQTDVQPVTFSADDALLLSRVSKWTLRHDMGYGILGIHITSEHIQLVKALCRLSGRSLQSFIIHGRVIVEEEVEIARNLILELARLGVALRCTFVVRILDKKWAEVCPGSHLIKEQRYNSVQELWPQGLPGEVQKVINDNRETRAT